ncbi:MAG: PAS domain-containing protein, partial [Pseudolabrys sp.]
MASQDPAALARVRYDRKAFDKSQNAPRGGSISLVLVVAAVLIAAAGGLVYIGHDYVEAYVLTLLAVLGTVGVFALFAAASGIMRFAGKDQGNPLLKAVVDGAFDGIVVTDHAGRVFYANATYLDLIGATGVNDVRPIERVFIGDPDVSEAIYRLLKAAREGRRLQEEVRVTGMTGEGARWLRLRVRPLGENRRDARMTVWS